MAVYINIGQADKSIRIHYAALRRITVKGFCSTVNDSPVSYTHLWRRFRNGCRQGYVDAL